MAKAKKSTKPAKAVKGKVAKTKYSKADLEKAARAMLKSLANSSSNGLVILGCCTQSCCD